MLMSTKVGYRIQQQIHVSRFSSSVNRFSTKKLADLVLKLSKGWAICRYIRSTGSYNRRYDKVGWI